MADVENGDRKMRSYSSGYKAIASGSPAKFASYANDGPRVGRRALRSLLNPDSLPSAFPAGLNGQCYNIWAKFIFSVF